MYNAGDEQELENRALCMMESGTSEEELIDIMKRAAEIYREAQNDKH